MSDWNFNDWYEENGEDLNKRRRDRYKTDPQYKERVLQTNRQSREKRRSALMEEQEKEQAAKKFKLQPKTWKEREDDGQKLLSIGALARALGKSVQVLRLWEREKIIPPPSTRTPKGDRFYTPEDLLAIRNILKEKGRLDDTSRPKPRTRLVHLRVKLADGEVKEETLYSIGVFAKAIGRSVVTLEQMERRDALPPTPFRTPKGHRVYSPEMITVVKHALESRSGRIRGEAWKSFRAEVIEGWTKAKVIGAEVLGVVGEDAGKEKQDVPEKGA